MEPRRYKVMIIRPMTGEVFLTMYTQQLDRKMARLIRTAYKQRIERMVSALWQDLPPQDKGAILLKKWEMEGEDNA